MASALEVELALKERLGPSTVEWTIVWPNQDFDAPPPYVRCEVVPTSTRDDTLDGTFEILSGYMMLTVITKENVSTRTALEKAGELKRLFAYGTVINLPSGEGLTIMQPPEVLGGFPAGAKWNLPVRVSFEV